MQWGITRFMGMELFFGGYKKPIRKFDGYFGIGNLRIGFPTYLYRHFPDLPKKGRKKSSKSFSNLLLHVPLWGGSYSVVNKRGR